jgi:hypothetical protein
VETKSALYQIPVPSTEVGGKVQFDHDGGTGRISFEYFQGASAYVSAIEFRRVRAFRHRAELYCSAWHIEGAYDTLVEIAPSRWAREINADAPEGGGQKWSIRHFLIYLDSAGAYEVLAESWSAKSEIR